MIGRETCASSSMWWKELFYFANINVIRETDIDLPSRKAAACKMSFKDAKAHRRQ